jgi:hypothetical protein
MGRTLPKMPLLIGHAAIGSLTYEVTSRESALQEWKLFLRIVFLANLPDIDNPNSKSPPDLADQPESA